MKRIDKLKLSKLSEDLLFQVLFTNAYAPTKNLSSDEFSKIKINWLIEKKRIEDLGEKSHLVFYTPGSLSRILKFNSFIIDEIATDWSLVSLKYKFIPKIARNGFGSHILISAPKF